MTDHTPEPWTEHDMRLRYLVLDDPDWERARACVNACAGIPTEQLGDVKALVETVQAARPLAAKGCALLPDAERVYADIITPLDAALAPFLRKD